MKLRRRPHIIAPADITKGAQAESAFRKWLDAAVLPHIYVEQSPLTVPEPLREQIKRPDYIVGIPGVGMVAFDVKAKTIYPEGLIFDLDEVPAVRRSKVLTLCMPIERALLVSMDEPFYSAFVRAVALN
ncbi:hypothetical protein B2M20_02340 [Nitrobacter vulgaris]|uniref:NERD domain-containing protein n=2 Tax=Nitrobacter vulgaris TaxID=29421 RepID=A0A1V4I2F5_NITVU|nr:hypothetical protein B2M20_02340 [Nitrobacter vulgaris]